MEGKQETTARGRGTNSVDEETCNVTKSDAVEQNKGCSSGEAMLDDLEAANRSKQGWVLEEPKQTLLSARHAPLLLHEETCNVTKSDAAEQITVDDLEAANYSKQGRIEVEEAKQPRLLAKEMCISAKSDATEQNTRCSSDEAMLDDLEANCVEMEETKQPLLSSTYTAESVKEILATLDVFRRVTIVAVILLDYGSGVWYRINYSRLSHMLVRNEVTFGEIVTYLLLFIVGVGFYVAFCDKKLHDWRSLWLLKLCGLGLVLLGWYLHVVYDPPQHRFMFIVGVFQRIAIAHFVLTF